MSYMSLQLVILQTLITPVVKLGYSDSGSKEEPEQEKQEADDGVHNEWHDWYAAHTGSRLVPSVWSLESVLRCTTAAKQQSER